MIRWSCDNCGATKTGFQIVGHEFDYSSEFSSLAMPLDGKRDLCTACMTKVNRAYNDAKRAANASSYDAARKALGSGEQS